jgi:hypothetical protein
MGTTNVELTFEEESLASSLHLKVHEVVSRILSDAEFAASIKVAAVAAVSGGAGSEAWKAYFEHFASTPGELAQLGIDDATGCTCNSNTYMTLSSLVTPVPTCCATTTTTTTSGNYFGV